MTIELLGYPKDLDARSAVSPAEAVGDKIGGAFDGIALAHSLLQKNRVRRLMYSHLLDRLPLAVPGAEIHDAVVTVDISVGLLEAARQAEHARHEIHLDALAYRQIKARMDFLRDVCLKDPGAARLFSLIPPSPRLAGMPLVDPEEVVKVVSQWAPGSGWVVAAQKLLEFGEKLTSDQFDALAKLVQDAMARFGEADLGVEFAAAVGQAAALNGVSDGAST
ncbi:hypothetical protein [Amycolatopsis sp. CB00013]|uniref:hypothetical protein n=1 Tax=Amycolatopsis sp. CB00013 TaxID=1703945 RepID=UPI0013014289|nr:hypothetical protein [Amycolatopsis sp. CB00013]